MLLLAFLPARHDLNQNGTPHSCDNRVCKGVSCMCETRGFTFEKSNGDVPTRAKFYDPVLE